LRRIAYSAACVLICGLLLCRAADLPAQGPDPAAPPSAAPASTPTDAPQPPTGIFQIIFSGGPVGIAIMLVLIGLSLTAAYLVFEHMLTIRRSEIMPEGLADEVRGQLLSGRLHEAEQTCRQRPSFLSFVLLSGMGELDGGWNAVEEALEDAAAEQAARLLRKIEYLSVIANIAPMVGLLGTVVGMILCFHEVASTQGSAGAAQLAEGIYQALVTTVAGLIIAIPALGAFAIFRNRVDQFVAEAAYQALHVFTPLKRARGKRGGAAPAAPPVPPPVEGAV
jgi:biopolymer transport protein ExbB